MPQVFPLSSYGNRMISVTLRNGAAYWLRTYYSAGQINAWFFDMWDAQMEELVKGVPVVTGSANLLAAYPDKFPAGAKLIAVLTDGAQDSPDALGSDLELVWYGADEASPYVIPDPMLEASTMDFQIPGREASGDHSVLNNRFIPNQHNIGAVQGLAETLADKASLEQLNQKLSDAPKDGYTYGRRNGAWSVVGSGGGGSGGGGSGGNHFSVDGSSLILLMAAGGSAPDESFFFRDGASLILREATL